MSVLPSSATFWSFFLVLLLLLLLTITLGVLFGTILQDFKTRAIHGLQSLKLYIASYKKLVNPFDETYELRYVLPDEEDSWLIHPLLALLALLTIIPVYFLRSVVMREIYMPSRQYFMFVHRENEYLHVRYHPVKFLIDIIRGALIPAWIVVAIVIMGYLVSLDVLCGLYDMLSGRNKRKREEGEDEASST